MSQTKLCLKWLKTASVDEIRTRAASLEQAAANEKNVLIRSSYSQQLRMCKAKLEGKTPTLYS